MVTRRVAVVGLPLLAALLLAGCTGDTGDGPPRSTPPSTSASETTEPAPTTAPPLSPDEQAAADAALAAYNGGWGVQVQAIRDPGAKPDWRLDFQQFFAEPLLSEILGGIYGYRDAGLAAPAGEPSRAPIVTDVDLNRMQVSITDCVDSRPWPFVVVATGAPGSTPRAPGPVSAQVSYNSQLARWLVIEQEADLEATC